VISHDLFSIKNVAHVNNIDSFVSKRIWRNFLLLSWRGSDQTGLKRRKDANQSVPIVSYSYTNSIGRKIVNYKEALQDINIEEYLKNPILRPMLLV
jgi:hypothetical protein